ncbi:MAG TPA: long-chain fatty acid--CoA ligase [Myxococcaceae bacterium]|nr:long-chain fatty acid--CoA ligase [Myxococcaceae bacterium]
MRAQTQYTAQPGASKRTLLQLLLERAVQPDRIAAKQKRNGVWEDATWGRVLEEVRKLSAALVAEGIRPGDKVAIFAATSLQWVICDLAIGAARAVAVPIYASNTPDECKYILNHSESVLAFVDNDVGEGKQAGRVTRIRQRLDQTPQVRKVVLFEGVASGPRETTLAQLIRAGEESIRSDPRAFDERVREIRPEDPCCFIYTSGTTGDPKGVVLTHANWAYEAEAVAKIGLMEGDDSVMLFLPLAHSFAQVVKAAWLGLGFQMVFAESVDKLVANLGETHPTILPAVPRVFEKVYNNVVQNGSAAPGVKGKLFRWAFKLFDEYVDAKNRGKEYSSLGFALARRLVFAKVHATLSERLGGRMRLFVSGGAPLSRKIAYFFDLLGFKVLEGYGLTETSAATCVNRPEKIKIGAVGPAVPGTEIQIGSDGEILIRGPGVMVGYYKNDAATAEVLEKDGWFHSGDIGEMDRDGYVRITDRKKDIIVTAGGKNVAPQNIENLLKTFALISQSMVYGDRRKYLAALICVNEEAARKVLADKGVTAPQAYAEVARRPEIREEVQKIIDQVNAEQPSYSTLKRFAIMDQDFTQESGELTPTLKVKRKFATQKYKAILDGLYDGEALVD